jgi:hypothetical protein
MIQLVLAILLVGVVFAAGTKLFPTLYPDLPKGYAPAYGLALVAVLLISGAAVSIAVDSSRAVPPSYSYTD